MAGTPFPPLTVRALAWHSSVNVSPPIFVLIWGRPCDNSRQTAPLLNEAHIASGASDRELPIVTNTLKWRTIQRVRLSSRFASSQPCIKSYHCSLHLQHDEAKVLMLQLLYSSAKQAWYVLWRNDLLISALKAITFGINQVLKRTRIATCRHVILGMTSYTVQQANYIMSGHYPCDFWRRPLRTSCASATALAPQLGYFGCSTACPSTPLRIRHRRCQSTYLTYPSS